MLEQLVKKYVEFIKLDSSEKRNVVAQHHLGPKVRNGKIMIDGELKQRWRITSATDFFETFGVNLSDYENFFAEVGGAVAPEGPLIPGKIGPILVVRQTNSGNFRVHMFKVDGYYNKDMTKGWVELDRWAEEIGDEDLARVAKKADEVSEVEKSNREKAEKQLKSMMGIVEDA